MQDFVTDKNLQAQADIVQQLHLINVAEIEILKEVLFVIDTKYLSAKRMIEPAAVCALILNDPDIPGFYATSTKGYFKQQSTYLKQYRENICQRLLSDAIEDVYRRNIPRTLHQDVVIANSTVLKKIRSKSWRSLQSGEVIETGEFDCSRTGYADIFDVLANLSLTNLIENEVIIDAHSHIYTDYQQHCDRISLSDVCALVLNHENVPAFYVTNAREYNQCRQGYLTQYQSKIRKVIRQTVSQVHREGSENSF